MDPKAIMTSETGAITICFSVLVAGIKDLKIAEKKIDAIERFPSIIKQET